MAPNTPKPRKFKSHDSQSHRSQATWNINQLPSEYEPSSSEQAPEEEKVVPDIQLAMWDLGNAMQKGAPDASSQDSD